MATKTATPKKARLHLKDGGPGSPAYDRKKARLLKQGLVGFALMRALDPEAFARMSIRAGKKAQKLHGHRVRWSKAKARKLAGVGGRAAQKQYRKTGHPLVLRAQAKRQAEAQAQAKRKAKAE